MKSLYSSIYNLIHNSPQIKQSVELFSTKNIRFPLNVTGIQGSFFSFYVNELTSFSKDFIIIVPTEYEANNLLLDFQSLFPQLPVYVFPSWGAVPYKACAKGSVVFGKRSGVLSTLSNKTDEGSRIFIFTQRSFLSPLVPPEYLKKSIIRLSLNDKIDTVSIARKLTDCGYTKVSRVSVRGEFSLRGEVLDIFLPLAEYPARIVFDFDQITSFKLFETDSQTTVKAIENLTIYPMKEVIWNDELTDKLETELLKYNEQALKEDIHLPFTDNAMTHLETMLEELRTKNEAEGEELFYQLLWDKEYYLNDYLSGDDLILFYDYDRLENAQISIEREYNGMYRKIREDFPVLHPQKMISSFSDMLEKFSRSIYFRTLSENFDKTNLFEFKVKPSRSFFGNINYMKEELQKLQDDNWNVYIFTDNENQQLRINEIFKDFTEPENNKKPVLLIPKAIYQGFEIPEIKLLVIQENEIFGRRKYVAKSVNKAKSQVIDTFIELNPGDYVVHVNWGIGLFHGIERVKSLGNERDYIKLEYADEEFAFVPIEQVNLVQLYIGNEGEKPRLDRIGSKSWENRKNKVQKAVEELAHKLIDLYSRRKASVGFAFPKETQWQAAFEAAFPYEDTQDQITVTEEVKQDMEKPVPMDRLICGDVGYGKTEIAMRAAFKAVMGGKQVAFLAPTTILCEQHYDTCVERFKNFPVKIERLSRFVQPSDQKKILSKLENGEIDILIGTHRIIQKDVKFKNLGLMIIDEEQRFGVKDKEKLKEMKTNVDCLTMSATPIPRTLHMSLLKIRDMSLLTTPPQNRIPIETTIDEFSEEKVASAIRKEMERGGQIFYLHNRVESLQETRIKIEKIVPECLVDIAHGQMTSSELDEIFHRFKMGAFHVLIATTIIENGIDIPNVNTIIIDRADMYGVSQLYQLRGRVGRSDRKAYAYLLYPQDKALSEVAMKRLQVISDFTELGSGFKIAMKDMEIRGAGNLLGRDQSGDVYAVGFDLYMKLLNEAVNRLTAQKDYIAQSEVLMELEYTGYIPDTYVTIPQIKIEIYKKIASITTDNEFEAVIYELNDRFGPIPEEVSSLLALAEIRIICRKLNIKSLREKTGEVKVEFSSVENFSIDKFMKLLNENPGTIRLVPTMPNVLFIKLGKIGLREKSEFIREKLNKLI
ncbi:MAG: transcription-repair coupling factor [Treponema sp.]|nr:transcription-repair coupling factor [Treponema sp.]